MACLFALFAGIFPRLGLFIIWVARPARVDAAFDGWVWPLLGLIFLPFATLIYVVLWTAGGLSSGRLVLGDPGRLLRRRALGGRLVAAHGRHRATRPGPDVAAGDDPVDRVAVRRLLYVNLVAAVAFVFGGSLFALGAPSPSSASAACRAVNITYLVGGFFFSLGGYVSILLAVNSAGTVRNDPPSDAVVDLPAATASDWLSAFVLFVGTLLFAVSLVAAFAEGLTPRQSNGWIWLPDIPGCVCFLVSGHLALLDVGERPDPGAYPPRRLVGRGRQPDRLRPVLPAGLAAFTRPATSRAVDIGLVNWGTFAGAVCFASAGSSRHSTHPLRHERRSTLAMTETQ